MRLFYFLTATLPIMFVSGCAGTQASPSKPPIIIDFNADFIESTLADPLNFQDRDAVLTALFKAKPDGFTVYPSEGYYYFTFTNAGERIKGNFRFDVQDRDAGKFNFIYYKELAYSNQSEAYDNYWILGQDGDGVQLVKTSPFHYKILFKNFSIPVYIYDAKQELKLDKKLGQSEQYVGPIFDESGIRFHLIFDNKANKFLYVLNDMFGYPESYSALDQNDRILIGTRSRFAYYNDKKNDRYVLIGVSQKNIRDNNYYDGPFDQLPDSFVDPIHLKDLIEKHEPRLIGKIGPYGDFLEEEDTRYAITPYMEYYSTEDLQPYLSCTELEGSRSTLNKCLSE